MQFFFFLVINQYFRSKEGVAIKDEKSTATSWYRERSKHSVFVARIVEKYCLLSLQIKLVGIPIYADISERALTANFVWKTKSKPKDQKKWNFSELRGRITDSQDIKNLLSQNAALS